MHLHPADHSPLCPSRWPFPLAQLPPSAHVVGGIVRDAILDRQGDYLDLDVVVPVGAVELAQALAQRHGAGFVVLDAQRQIARVVFGDATVDFALQEGKTLELDLKRRDFTINAMAYNPHTQELIDPLQGYQDLQGRQLRMVSAQNLQADPLRLLRAFRQAAQLGFTIEAQTQETIARLAPHLATTAAERIQSELNTLLHHPQGVPWLQAAWEAGLFRLWLPHWEDQALMQLQRLDAGAQWLIDRHPSLASTFRKPLPLSRKENSPRTGLALAKLVTLLAWDDQAAEKQWQRLKGSRAEMRAVGLLRRLQGQLPPAHAPQCLSLRQQHLLFQGSKNLFPVLALLGFTHPDRPWDAHGLGDPRQPALPGTLLEMVDRFVDPQDPIAHLRPWITGQDLIQDLAIPPGPHIGQLLMEVQVAQAEGAIDSRASALAWAENWWQTQPSPR